MTSWTLKSIEDGDVVAERRGLSHREAVRAIYAAMSGDTVAAESADAAPTAAKSEASREAELVATAA